MRVFIRDYERGDQPALVKEELGEMYRVYGGEIGDEVKRKVHIILDKGRYILLTKDSSLQYNILWSTIYNYVHCCCHYYLLIYKQIIY